MTDLQGARGTQMVKKFYGGQRRSIPQIITARAMVYWLGVWQISGAAV